MKVVRFGIPYFRDRADELYRTNPLFHAAVKEWSDATDSDVSTILDGEEGVRFTIPLVVLTGFDDVDEEMFRKATEGLPISLCDTGADPDRALEEYYSQYYPDEMESEDVHGTPKLEEIYDRVCELKELIEQHREMTS